MYKWFPRFWALATLMLAAIAALLALVPFTDVLGMILLVVALLSAAGLLYFGRKRFGVDWAKSLRFFAWWGLALSLVSLVLAIVVSGEFNAAGEEVESAASVAEFTEG